MASNRCGTSANPWKLNPTQADIVAPAMAWPWPPMLNRPALKPSPMARPAQMSGAAWAVVAVMACHEPNAPSNRAE